jgi:hypothetical protein
MHFIDLTEQLRHIALVQNLVTPALCILLIYSFRAQTRYYVRVRLINNVGTRVLFPYGLQ